MQRELKRIEGTTPTQLHHALIEPKRVGTQLRRGQKMAANKSPQARKIGSSSSAVSNVIS